MGLQLCQEWTQCAGLKDLVAATRRVARNITQRPYRLLPNIIVARLEQSDKLWYGSMVDYHFRVVARSTGYVCQSPRRLKLQRGVVVPGQKLYELRYNIGCDDLVDRWISLDR